MTLPAVNITELDGALGILPATAGKILAFVGPANDGPYNLPAAFARTQDLLANYQGGRLVEAAANYINTKGRPAVVVRTGETTPAAISSIVHAGTGTSVASAASGAEPPDDYQYVIRFLKNGTIGQAPDGITYQASYDGGRTWEAVTSLGADDEIALDGVTFEFAAGTVKAGDTYSAQGTAATWNGTELGAAIDVLGQSTLPWDQALIVSPVDSTAVDLIDGKFEGIASRRGVSWIGYPRLNTAGETPAAYRAALGTGFSQVATVYGSLVAGGVKLTSGVSGRKYRRPLAWSFAAEQGVASEEENVADINRGPLVGAAIRDVNGNVDEHDEAINPGLDDLGFVTARTWDGYPGTYITRPRLFSPQGSDFQLVSHRRVLNLAETVLRNYFIRRLNRPVRVNTATGFILEADALEIELGALSALRTALLSKPKASGAQFVLSRTDNVLSNKTLTGTARVLPLANPEYINVSVGYYNPALSLLAA